MGLSAWSGFCVVVELPATALLEQSMVYGAYVKFTWLTPWQVSVQLPLKLPVSL